MKNIIFNKRGSAVKSFFRDLIESPDTLAIDVNVPCKNKLLDLIRMVHTSQTIRKKVNLPFQDIWFSMKEIRAFADEVSNFIFVSEALAFINIDVLKKIQAFQKTRAQQEGLGLGIQNTIERISLIYESGADLIFSNAANGGAKVDIFLPRISQDRRMNTRVAILERNRFERSDR